MKQLLRILCAIILLATSPLAYGETFTEGNLKYTTSGTTASVVAANNTITSADIPETIKYNGTTYTVTSIGNYAFQFCSSLSEITIPNSVTSIGNSAFSGCSSLSEITIPNSVTSIGFSVFYGCSSLSEIPIPNSVTEIGNSAFYGCSSLSEITIPNSVTEIGTYAFGNCSSLSEITIPNSVTSIEESAFSRCSSLTEITISNSVTEIGNSAFYGCSSLSEITIPNSVTSIGFCAFSGCKSLTEITIPNSVTSIGNDAFEECSSLAEITIPNSVSSIGVAAFQGCTSLTEITIPNSVSSIGGSAFSGCFGLKKVNISDLSAWCGISFGDLSANPLSYAKHIFLNDELLNDIVIPDGIESINDYTFINGIDISSVTIPNSVTSIGNYAFYLCKSLTEITIPNSVTSIGSGAFSGCSSAVELNLSDSLTQIPQNAFYECKSLITVNVPEGVTSIGNYAFYGCSSLEELTLGAKLTSIGEKGFADCSNLAKIRSLNPTPPEITTSVFSGVDKETCQLIVTKGNLVYYWLDPVWKEFLNISDDLVYLSPLPSVVYGDAPVDLSLYAPEGFTFTYETSNPDVALIDDTMLSIVGAGTATVGALYDQSGTPMEIIGQMRQFVVDKAELTIEVENMSIEQGQPIPAFILKAEGLVYDETLEDVGEMPEIICEATETSAPGEYPIYLVGGESRNYKFNLVAGVLTILGEDTSAIDEIKIDDNFGSVANDETDGTVHVFNYNGILIYEGPEDEMVLDKGIYIFVKGKESKKILIK